MAHVGSQQGPCPLLGAVARLGELEQGEDRSEESQCRGHRVEPVAEVARADESGEDAGLEGEGLLDPVVAQASSDLRVAVLADDEQAAQSREFPVVQDGVEEALGDRRQLLFADSPVSGERCAGGGDRDAQRGRHLGHARVGPFDEGVEDRLFGGEVLVDRALAHAGVASEVADGGAAPSFPGEAFQGGVEQTVPCRR